MLIKDIENCEYFKAVGGIASWNDVSGIFTGWLIGNLIPSIFIICSNENAELERWARERKNRGVHYCGHCKP